MLKKAICFLSAAFVLTFISATEIHASQEPVSVKIPVVVEGNSNTTVMIYSDEANMALLDKAEVNNESEFSFTVTSNTPGNHVYTITQSVSSPVDGVNYDKTEYIAEAYFQDEDGTLTGTAIIYPKDSGTKYPAVHFKNLSTEGSNTGTAGKNIEMYALITGLGIMMLGSGLVILARDRKTEDEPDADGHIGEK